MWHMCLEGFCKPMLGAGARRGWERVPGHLCRRRGGCLEGLAVLPAPTPAPPAPDTRDCLCLQETAGELGPLRAPLRAPGCPVQPLPAVACGRLPTRPTCLPASSP